MCGGRAEQGSQGWVGGSTVSGSGSSLGRRMDHNWENDECGARTDEPSACQGGVLAEWPSRPEPTSAPRLCPPEARLPSGRKELPVQAESLLGVSLGPGRCLPQSWPCLLSPVPSAPGEEGVGGSMVRCTPPTRCGPAQHLAASAPLLGPIPGCLAQCHCPLRPFPKESRCEGQAVRADTTRPSPAAWLCGLRHGFPSSAAGD